MLDANLSVVFSEDLDDIIDMKKQVALLPDKYKVVVSLLAAGYNQKTSGELLGITRVAVGLMHKRALARLRLTMGVKHGS